VEASIGLLGADEREDFDPAVVVEREDRKL
jgi:hypothetical protein